MQGVHIRVQEEGEGSEERDERNDADVEELMLCQHIRQLHQQYASYGLAIPSPLFGDTANDMLQRSPPDDNTQGPCNHAGKR